MKISNEIKVGLTVLAAIVFGFIGFRVMSDLPILRTSNSIRAYFSQADGLSAGNYIYLNGVTVGSIKRIQLAESGDSVLVEMNLNLDVDIPKNSTAYLESSGLLNEKAIVIERGDAEENLEYGDTIKGVYRGGMMETLKQEGEQLSEDVSESFEKLNRLLAQLNTMIDDTTRGNLESTLSDVRTTTKNIATIFEGKRIKMESSIDHAERILANVDTVSARNKGRVDSVMIGLEKSLTELQTLSQDLQQTNSQLNQVLTKINNGEGSLGKMINDPTLYNNLESMSAEMDQLIKNINKNPKKYLKHMRLIEIF